MKIELDVSEKNECTSAPWWVIIDPRRNFEVNSSQAWHNIAGMITGPFFSREEAEQFLAAKRYNFGKNPVVFCMSGCYSRKYREAYRDAEKKEEAGRDG